MLANNELPISQHFRIRFFAALLATFTALQSWAVGTRNVSYFGPTTCRDWTNNAERAAVKDPGTAIIARTSNRTWLLAFMSGLNAGYPTDKDALSHVDAEAIILWMDNYCRANVESDVYTGARKLFRELLRIAD